MHHSIRTFRTGLVVIMLSTILALFATPQPANALSITGGVTLSCSGIDGGAASVAFNRDNTGLAQEAYAVIARDGNGNVIFYLSGAFALGTTAPFGTGAYTTPPTANPLSLVVLSIAGNGQNSETVFRASGTCEGLPTGTPRSGVVSTFGVSGNLGGAAVRPGEPGEFILRTIVCDVPVYGEPGGNQLTATIRAGQTWFVGENPTRDARGRSWSAIRVSTVVAWIPTSCVAR
jgi:hypothetical protein